MLTRTPLLCAILMALLYPVALLAIMMRHDVAPEEYLVPPEPYPYVCTLGGATGTAIAPHWVLTAAHVAKYIRKGATVTCGKGEEGFLADVYLYPGTRLFLPDHWDHDIALVRLDQPLPYSLFPGINRDKNEAGWKISFLGRGGYGDGESGITREDSQLRRAGNRVESANGSVVTFRFTPPPQALPLEGISGPGDSGGPALIDGDTPSLLRVSSMQDSGDFSEGHYGVQEFYSRVSFYQQWIDQVLSAQRQNLDALAYRFQPCGGDLMTHARAQDYAGTYRLPDGRDIEFADRGGGCSGVSISIVNWFTAAKTGSRTRIWTSQSISCVISRATLRVFTSISGMQFPQYDNRIHSCDQRQ